MGEYGGGRIKPWSQPVELVFLDKSMLSIKWVEPCPVSQVIVMIEFIKPLGWAWDKSIHPGLLVPSF